MFKNTFFLPKVGLWSCLDRRD